MPVKELDREGDVAVVSEKKTKPPKRYQAVYRQDFSFVCRCNVGILSGVFNLSTVDAIGHIMDAVNKGQAAVLIGTKDLIETKVGQATTEAGKGCPALGKVSFTCEPL